MVAALDSLPTLEEARAWGARLLRGPVIYFPIRHHSPACSWHLKRLIEERRPAAVLIEGPASFTRLVPILTDAEAVPPIAVYTYCNVRPAEVPASEASTARPDRRGAYYPLSAYSPEWVAIQSAVRVGAEVQFIDMDFGDQSLVDSSDRLTGRTATLLSEHWFQRSAYLRTLATRLRCRDTDELWDRLFESWADALGAERFVSQVAAYCELARRGVTQEENDRDGTNAREAEMAWWIATCSERYAGLPVLVVTGGYHTVALPALVDARPPRPTVDRTSVLSSDSVCVRYSFDRMDRAVGYGAGMRSPAFYQRLWDAGPDRSQAALTLLATIAEQAREMRMENAPTTASLIAAFEQTLRLASLRGNHVPTRADLWDGIESCLLQGLPSDSVSALARLATTTLSGTALGSVPSSAGLPPIVADFYARARELRLKVDDTEPHQLALDVYSDERARNVSRLLHRAQYLEIPFASRVSGPNFTGRSLGKRLREVWTYGWSPQLESALIDAAAYGSSVLEATGQKFADELALEETRAASAQTAAERVALACQLGLHEQVSRSLSHLRSSIRDDPGFPSAVGAIHRIALLWQSREPLQATGLEVLPEIGRAAFDRAIYLISEIGNAPAGEAAVVASALVSMRELFVGSVGAWFDQELLWHAIESLASQVSGTAIVLGAATGMLYSADRLDEATLAARMLARLPEGADPREGIAYLRGVMLAAREVIWQSTVVLAALRRVVESQDETGFVRVLPDLRLALAVLTPIETDRFSQRLSEALGGRALSQTVERDVSAAEMQANVELSLRMRHALERDGLLSWVQP